MPDDIKIPDASVTTNGSDNSAFMEEVQNRLLGQSDIVSSMDTDLESSFNNAAQGIQSAQSRSSQRINSQFNREIAFQRGEGQSNVAQHLEDRTGFGTQMVALRRLVETTDKELKDLEQRKQELILQGESEAARQIANLEVEKIKFRSDAQQRVFQNLLGLGQFGQQQQQQNLAERRFGLDVSQFELQGKQFGLQAANQAFERMAKLQDMGALAGLADAELATLETDAGLPAGVAKKIASIPPNQEIRAVGDSLIAIDPRTLKTTVLYNKPAEGGGGGVNYGGTDVSFLTSSVMTGLQKLEDLTPTQRAEVTSEMTKLGFAGDQVPEWYRRQKLGSKEHEALMDVSEPYLKEDWDQYKRSIVYGPQFLNEGFFRSVFSQDKIDAGAEEAGVDSSEYLNHISGVVNTYRQAGFKDSEILKMMSD